MTELTPTVTRELCDLAKPFYNPALPYHNWAHAEEVMAHMRHIVEVHLGGMYGSLRAQRINLNLGLIAAAHHDNGHDHKEAETFPSKEHYSVHLAREVLTGKLSAEQLEELEQIILGTRFAVPRKSDLELILHYADVWNMASREYDDFFDHSIKLWEEYGRPEWREFQAGSEHVIGTTVKESLRPGDFSARTASWSDPYRFAHYARRNLELFRQESEPMA